MNLKDLNIAIQLKLGFAAMFFLVVMLGGISYWQSNKIHEQTEIMYNNPLKVRRAIGKLDVDILNIRIGKRNLTRAIHDQEKQEAVQLIEVSFFDAMQQFDILKSQYLGPKSDVDEAFSAFIAWRAATEEYNQQVLPGNESILNESNSADKNLGILRDKMLTSLQKIDNFAEDKGDSLFKISRELNDSLNRKLLLLVALILLLSLFIINILLRNIRKPLQELTKATRDFHTGNLNARSLYTSKNEFGILSDSFNDLAESIQTTRRLNENASSIAELMLSEDDANKFFKITLNALLLHTNSQMAAVYLLSTDKKIFEHFESIGFNDSLKESFAADSFEGEFGPVLSSQKIQHIKNIHTDTRFVFQSVTGSFIPREIISIPIVAGKQVVAIISMASLSEYNGHSIRLMNKIIDTLSARVESILAYRKVKGISKKLELQNQELEAQKTELASQSIELMEQNTELEMQKEQLHEASRLKTSFLSNMSHELRTPLNSVIALSGVLSRRLAKQVPEEEYSYLEVIERNGKHLLSVINDILDISRIEAGQEVFEITTFKAKHLIDDIVTLINPQARQKNIELNFLDNDIDISVTSDQKKCRHILQNLIGNAVKFTEKGKVEIKAKKSGGYLEVLVSDTGIGISQEHLPHIFDEFRQADGSTSRRFGGTGLGLAIAKKYALLLGGTITVKSTPDKGSEFTLLLPLDYSDENKITENETSGRFSRISRKTLPKQLSVASGNTILLVEDNEPAIIQMKDFLEESGYQILVASDGSEALEIIAHTLPDAMIIDLMMPGVDGFVLLNELRNEEATANIPVLVLTAKQITKDELKSLKRNNIHQLIQKGDVKRKELLSAIASIWANEPEEETKKPKRAVVGKPLVLVVEDNPDNMTTVKALLADDYTIIETLDGNEAIKMAKKHKPHLILMDIALPNMDGIEAFQEIRNNARLQHIPVIALTASAMTTDRETILAYGFDAYIAKPIEELLFYKTIKEILYGRQN
jgi:signal transduction histidine kinase/CheY-like chemotaxis protein/HAMP domain-containing protein